MKTYDFSVVIPTFNRSDLLERLVASLDEARRHYRFGRAEIIVIDSSQGEERQKIEAACARYGALFLEGPDSVRQKRNMGIRQAQYPYILFEDSDVVVDREIFNCHARTYIDSEGDPTVGGSFGVTEFTGEDNLTWRIIQYTTLTDSFSFAKKWPYQDWTIGNNVSFRKDVLEEVNLFEEAFPFRLGADDLDLSYRITQAGYKIRSQPSAVVYHTKDTWKKWKLVRERAVRWGRMEYYISCRHPQIFVNRFPKTGFVCPMLAVWFAALSAALGSWIPFLACLAGIALTCAGAYVLGMAGTDRKNPFLFFAAELLNILYYYGHIWEALKNGSLNGIYKQMSFSPGQTKMILAAESKRMIMLFVNMAVTFLLIVLLL